MTIRGGGNTLSDAHGIYTVFTNGCTIENLALYSCKYGLNLNHSWQFDISNVDAHGGTTDRCDIGVYMGPTTLINIDNAVTAYNTFATSTPAAMGPAGSPVTPTDTTSDAGRPPARPRSRPTDIDFGYTPSTASGGSSGGGSSTPQAPEYWDELIDKVREGEQAFEDYNQTVERGANAMADFFTSIADGSKSAKEAVADLLAQMAQVQMQRAFLTLASSGGTAGSIFGALGDALAVPSFAGGGTTGTGMRSGGVDGMGGFPAILHPNETVIDHTRGGAAGGASVVFNVDARGATADAAPAIEAALRRMTPQIVQQAVAASGKAMRSTKSFGNAR
jgi:hypothetical protein